MPKIIRPLTVADITKMEATPLAQRRDLRDGAVPGLRLRLGATVNAWDLYAQVRGKRAMFRLGFYPEMGLKEAREAARRRKGDNRGIVASGQPETLRGLVEYFGQVKGSKSRTWDEAVRAMERVFGHLMDKPLVKLTRIEVQHAADIYPAHTQGAYATRRVRPVLKFAQRRGLISYDFDARALELPEYNRVPRDRVLSDDELRSVLKSFGDTPYDHAARLILLTCCRKNEAAMADWSEFDLENRTWTIPAARFKTNRAMTFQLSGDAIKLLESLPTRTGRLFPGSMANWNRWQERMNERSGTSGWHRHDLRRTGATILARLGTPLHIINSILGHRHIWSAIQSVYVIGRCEAECRVALEDLANFYRKLVR